MNKDNLNTKVVVLSNETQYEALVRNGYDPETIKVMCDNPRFYSYLQNKKIDYYALEEFNIPESKRKAINAWGCDKAAHWIRIGKDRKHFRDFDFASSIFLRFGYILIQMLKNICYAREIIDRYHPSSVIVFSFSKIPVYPVFSGNIFLNNFLSEICETEKIRIATIKVDFKKDNLLRGLLSWRATVIGYMKNAARKVLNVLYSKITRPPKRIDLLAMGSLNHIGDALKEAKRRGIKIALYEYEFHIKSFNFARKHSIPYFIPGSFRRKSIIDSDEFTENLTHEILRSLDYACSKGFFKFNGHDFGKFVKDNIFFNIQSYCYVISKWANQCVDLLDNCDIGSFVLDENTSTRNAFVAAFLKGRTAKNKKTMDIFTISHATMPVNFSVSEENLAFALSTTLVNSEFEKLMYEVRGWDGEKIVVTGIPRYERLFRIQHQRKEPEAVRKKIKILFCGASMKLYWPERGGYLGLHIKNYGVEQRRALKAIITSIEGLPVELTVKPHNYEGEAWQHFLERVSSSNNIRFEPYSSDFFTLLNQNDVMILAHWSTAMIEAAICKKPTILLDFGSSKDLAPYAEFGYCSVVRNDVELKLMIENLCRQLLVSKDSFAEHSGERFEYVFGKRDLKNTERVVDYIEKHMNGEKGSI
tara:strand:+ start:96 stop:2030 length:1935 start_codon:yes stop_codon:yes gene_type:complete